MVRGGKDKKTFFFITHASNLQNERKVYKVAHGWVLHVPEPWQLEHFTLSKALIDSLRDHNGVACCLHLIIDLNLFQLRLHLLFISGRLPFNVELVGIDMANVVEKDIGEGDSDAGQANLC